jgi:mediator of RNA polymerase II transcription subunit 21
MYASLNYIQTRHPYGEIPGQPSQAPQPQPNTTPVNSAAPNSALSLPNGHAHAQNAQNAEPPSTPPPEDPHTFDAALRELARDLVLKEQQIEYLINSLPGLGNSEADQEKRMRELERELREVEAERARAEVEREALVEGLGQVLVGVKRVV